MSDFSSFALFTAGLAALTPLVSAYTQPKGDSPSGNAIYEPGLNSVVPAGKAYTITWDPTTGDKVSLLLCKGPSTNCVITSTIADSIDNSGSYSWTPSTDLEPSQPTGYGIELVVEGTGEYQYSTQFGISNSAYSGSSSSSSASASASSSVSSVSSASSASSAISSAPASSSASVAVINVNGKIVSSSSDAATSTANSTSAAAAAVTSAAAVNGTASAAGTGSVGTTGLPRHSIVSGWGYANSTNYKATGTGASSHHSTSLKTSTVTGSRTSSSAGSSSDATATSGSASASATQSGSAGQFSASFGGLAIAAGIAVFAL